MTHYIQDPVFWALLVVAVAAGAVAVRQRRTARKTRQEIDDLKTYHAELEKHYEEHYSEYVKTAYEHADEETKNVLKSAMRTLQVLAAEQQLIISRLHTKYGGSVVLQDLLEIDHMNSQFSRRAQSIAVLCEGWVGRQREVASVYDVVRSAQGRIRHFQRVEIFSQVDFGIASKAVEPVALALAELLDNATSYSSPDSIVEINVRTVPKGICIVVDDAGVGMNEEERAKATKLLSSERVSGVAALGNPPQFGFAVIGVLCERFGFTVSVDTTSPYGGVRAIVRLPDELLTSMPEPKEPDLDEETVAETALRRPESASAASVTADGLPKRRRKRPVALAWNGSRPARAPRRSDEDKAAIMAAFQQGTRAGRVSRPGAPEQTSDTGDGSSEGHDVS